MASENGRRPRRVPAHARSAAVLAGHRLDRRRIRPRSARRSRGRMRRRSRRWPARTAADRAWAGTRRGRRPFSLAIASIGVAFVLENVVRFVWGNDFRSYDVPVTRAMSIAGLRIGREQLVILGVAVVVMALAQAFLLRSRLGIAMRATADNPLLAMVKGVPTERVIAFATLGGGGLAGGAGVFLGLDASIDPLMGGGLIISVFAAAILGGIGSAPGALAGALIVGIMEEVGMLVVPPTYKTAIGFTIILAVLLVRPTGLAGARS